jgi:hypothetical protein
MHTFEEEKKLKRRERRGLRENTDSMEWYVCV